MTGESILGSVRGRTLRRGLATLPLSDHAAHVVPQHHRPGQAAFLGDVAELAPQLGGRAEPLDGVPVFGCHGCLSRGYVLGAYRAVTPVAHATMTWLRRHHLNCERRVGMTATITLPIETVEQDVEPPKPCPVARWCPNTNSEVCDSGVGCTAC